MLKLKVSDGEMITDVKQINKEIEEDYKAFLVSKYSPEDHGSINGRNNSIPLLEIWKTQSYLKKSNKNLSVISQKKNC